MSPFSLDDDTNPTLSNSITFNDLAAGSYTVTEALVADWTLSNVSCFPTGSGDTGTRTASIDLVPGGNVTCTFTSTHADAVISSAGPLTNIFLSTALNCQVDHTGDAAHEFYGGVPGACATEIANRGALAGPNSIPAGNSPGGYVFVSQTAVTGDGSVANPLTVVTVVDVGDTGLRITQTDSYVVGAESYRTDVVVTNTGGGSQSFVVYRGGDCYLQNSDAGFGDLDLGTGQVGCHGSDDNGVTPNNRIERWIPLTGGSAALESGYSSVWAAMSSQTMFPNTCLCGSYIDNGAGLSWSGTLGSGASATYSHLTSFSPTGVGSAFITKTAEHDTVPAGATDSYTITIHNPTGTPLTVTSITDHLPSGFGYVAGSTTGLTTNDPSVNGQDLTWTGSFAVPALGTATLTLGVVVPGVPGTYTNGVDAVGSLPITGVQTTAPITVTGGGSITIVKDAVPNGSTDFGFTTTGAGLSPFSLDDDADATLPSSTTFSNLLPGNYSVTEGAVAGWALTGLTCSAGGSGDTFDPDRDDHPHCGRGRDVHVHEHEVGFDHDREGRGPRRATDFAFTTTGAGLSSFSLDDDADGTLPNSTTFSGLLPGSFSVTEGAVAGWALTDLSCSRGGTGDTATGTATITLAAGADVTCTYTNTTG